MLRSLFFFQTKFIPFAFDSSDDENDNSISIRTIIIITERRNLMKNKMHEVNLFCLIATHFLGNPFSVCVRAHLIPLSPFLILSVCARAYFYRLLQWWWCGYECIVSGRLHQTLLIQYHYFFSRFLTKKKMRNNDSTKENARVSLW